MTSSMATGNIYLFASILFGAGAQVLLEHLLSIFGHSQDLRGILSAIICDRPLALAAAGIMILASFWFWMESLRRLPLSYAYPVACGSALLVMGFSAAFLGEAVTWRAFAGAIFVVLGTALLVSAS